MKLFFLSVCLFFIATNIIPAKADILISKLDDVVVSTPANLARDLIVTERLCVASDPVGVYGLVAVGSGSNGAFTIDSGPYSLPYVVAFRDRQSNNRFIELETGIPVSGFLTRQLVNSRNCRGNAGRLRIIIKKETLNQAVAGHYQGVIQLSVIPE